MESKYPTFITSIPVAIVSRFHASMLTIFFFYFHDYSHCKENCKQAILVSDACQRR